MKKPMSTTRLEAFSDGVIAIIITIMVLELKVPHELNAEALDQLQPVGLSYVLSFFTVAIMWINHHHMLHLADRATTSLLWLNTHLLFWMSLIPFSTDLLAEGHGNPAAACIYGINLAACSIAFIPLHDEVARQDGEAPGKRRARLLIEGMSVVAYIAGAALAFASRYAAYAVFALVPVVYFVRSFLLHKTVD